MLVVVVVVVVVSVVRVEGEIVFAYAIIGGRRGKDAPPPTTSIRSAEFDRTNPLRERERKTIE